MLLGRRLKRPSRHPGASWGSLWEISSTRGEEQLEGLLPKRNTSRFHLLLPNVVTGLGRRMGHFFLADLLAAGVRATIGSGERQKYHLSSKKMEPVRAYATPTPGILVPPEPAQRHPAPLATELGRCDVTLAAGKRCQGSAKSTAVSHLCSSMTSQTSGDTTAPTFPGPALRILPEARGESVRSRTIGCADPERLSGPRVRERAQQPRSGISRLRMLPRLAGFQSTGTAGY